MMAQSSGEDMQHIAPVAGGWSFAGGGLEGVSFRANGGSSPGGRNREDEGEGSRHYQINYYFLGGDC